MAMSALCLKFDPMIASKKRGRAGAVFLFIPRRGIEKSASFAGYFLPLCTLKDNAVPLQADDGPCRVYRSSPALLQCWR